MSKPQPGEVRSRAERMFGDDQASQSLGMQLLEVTPGAARLQMTVTAAMLNGHGMCHGGMIFALADSAFAFACNSHGEVTVAAAGSIEFLAPARAGERLIAEARELWRAGRNGLYDVAVTNAAGTVVAQFRGRSRRITPAKPA